MNMEKVKNILKLKEIMRTIIKNGNGTYWVRYGGRYVGTFENYEEAKKAKC